MYLNIISADRIKERAAEAKRIKEKDVMLGKVQSQELFLAEDIMIKVIHIIIMI